MNFLQLTILGCTGTFSKFTMHAVYTYYVPGTMPGVINRAGPQCPDKDTQIQESTCQPGAGGSHL
jgi:hypothetical protein